MNQIIEKGNTQSIKYLEVINTLSEREGEECSKSYILVVWLNETYFRFILQTLSLSLSL